MKHNPILSAISITALLAAAATVYAQQPPDVVQSDFGTNTAMGTGVMEFLQPASQPGIGGAFGNTGVGYNALLSTTTALYNTAVGAKSLQSNTGDANTAVGNNALNQNTTGFNNAATGLSALASNTSGSHNVADGPGALFGNTTGQSNTASGDQALAGGNNPDMIGNYNTADGAEALFSNTTGNKNTASGYLALTSNTTGSYNTASGYQALYYNIDGIRNSASGDWGLYSNIHGSDNTASGQAALYSNTTGSNNIGLGANAGYNLTAGSNNIEIGNEGTSSDNGIIRIGTAGSQIATYVAGIENAKVTGAAVYVTAGGQLGVLASSERYKTAIAPMGAGTEKLQELRPVTFHLKTDPNGPVQYGLIAEEVAKVYPELVIRDDAGKIQGVRYEELAPMLLNEVQKQQRVNAAQAEKIASLEQQLAGIQTALANLQPKGQLVAQR
jgi:hypothetical protein